MAHGRFLRLLQFFGMTVSQAMLDFDVLDEIQYFPRQDVRKFLNFLENLFSRRHIVLPLLGHQGHIQAFYYGLKAVRKQSIGFSQPTGLGKRCVLEVV